MDFFETADLVCLQCQTRHLPTTSQSMAENVAFTFDLPYPMLKALNDFLDKPENEGEEEEERMWMVN